MVSGAASGARAVERCDALGVAPYSDVEGQLFRAYLTPAHRAAQQAIGGWMVEAGMHVRQDAMANIIGRYEGSVPNAPALMIGSHIDSVRDAGRYDGPLGVMLGIECVAALQAAGRRMPFAIEVVGFGDEEGSRFPAAMLTTRAVVGALDSAALDISDGAGVSVMEALAEHGAEGDYLSARRAPEEIFAYLEAHIEQGPALEAKGLALGVVTGIAAQLRYAVTIGGMAGHAGTTAMGLRHDALAAAAEMVLAIERVALDDASDLVATVGRIVAAPGAANVIAGKVDFTIDIRSGDAARRDRAAVAILTEIAAIAARRNVTQAAELIHDLPASPCDPRLMGVMDAAMANASQLAFALVSGAGHDAMVMAALCPTAMLFIRCREGISHNPAEHVEPADVEIALQVMLGFIERLGDDVDA